MQERLLDQPFQFQKVVISRRDGDYWDAGMAHNPFVLKIDHQYVMFYIGTQNGSYEKRAIGYATADTLDGEWTRSDKPLALPPNANNPSVLVDRDGSILLYYRDGQLKVSVARVHGSTLKMRTHISSPLRKPMERIVLPVVIPGT